MAGWLEGRRALAPAVGVVDILVDIQGNRAESY